MISFDNTEIAFKSKSEKDLKKAYWLFKIVGNSMLVKLGKVITNFSLKVKLPIKGIIKKTIFHQFCGGETIQECDKTIHQLSQFGIGTILDYSIEGKTSEKDFNTTVKVIVETIQKAKKNSTISFGVFKVTGISRFEILEKANPENAYLTVLEQKELAAVINRVDIICQAGFNAGISIFIDAEETWIQDTIDRITVQMMKKYNLEKAIVYNTAQMYRHDRLEFLKKEIKDAREGNYFYGIKLVRGAYMEKERDRATHKNYPSPIQPTKDATDSDYNKALELIVDNIDVISLCAGTHNEASSNYLTELIAQKGLAKDDSRICFAQLLGMSDHISYNLAFNNFRVTKYVPFGPIEEVMPYLLRRADENTSVAGQTSRELRLIMSEINRRKI
jgi:proline dehydrogenase